MTPASWSPARASRFWWASGPRRAWITTSPSAGGAGCATATIAALPPPPPCTDRPCGSRSVTMAGGMSDNVILVGFMGAGKSSVGRLLARRMGRCFVETDDMITAREGRSIPEIFAERGEAHFRALEEEAVRLLALKSGDVIATGGGLYCREGRPEALRAIGTVVWLTGSFDVLYERARRVGERPMLAGRTRAEVAAIYH